MPIETLPASAETVQQMWDSFALLTLPKDCHPIQRQEMRRAFYAGTFGMLMACSAIGEESVSEDTGVMRLELWRLECLKFYQDMKEGKA